MTDNETQTTKEAPAPEDTAPQAERKTNKAVKVSLWVGIPTIALILILWVLHNWFGYWIFCGLSRGHSTTIRIRVWCFENMPLWLIGKGLVRVGESNSGLSILHTSRYPESIKYILFALRNCEDSKKITALNILWAEDYDLTSELPLILELQNRMSDPNWRGDSEDKEMVDLILEDYDEKKK
ncbi:hypothetical protein ACFL6F_02975 [Planctomycetota bacterium]